MSEKLVSKLKFRAMEKYPYLSSLIGRTEVFIKKDLQFPGATDGEVIYINPSLVSDFKEMLGVFMHEVLHIAFMHAPRFSQFGESDEYRNLYNILADVRINDILLKEGFALPRGIVTPDNVLQVIKESGWQSKEATPDVMVKFTEELAKDENESTDKAFSLAKQIYELKQDNQNEGNGYKQQDLIKSDKSPSQLEEEIKAKIIQGMMSNGKEPGNITDSIYEQLRKIIVKESIDWAKILKQGIEKDMKRKVDWNEYNKKTYQAKFKYILPTLKRLPKYHIIIAIDTSGSMNTKTLERIAGEVFALSRRKNVIFTIIQADTKIQKIEEKVRDKDKLIEAIMQVKGRGGTAFEPVLEWARKNKADSLVYFTDGCANKEKLPRPKGKVWWVLVGNNTDPDGFEFGKVLEVRE